MTEAVGDPMGAIRPVVPTPQPHRSATLCRLCGNRLHDDLISLDIDVHPNCEDNVALTIAQPVTEPGTDHPMRTELIRIIKFRDSNSARSLQAALGPSQIGGTCDRRLAMQMAGVRRVNRQSDPWPAIVGTAVHDWLERALQRENQEWVKRNLQPPWLTERRVAADPLIVGTSDVYHIPSQTVVDWKTMGDTTKSHLKKEGPGDPYKIQIQTYGLGYLRAGFQVRKVGLMFLPRAGYLKDALYYEWDFNPAIAQAAIERVYRVASNVHAMIQANPGVDIWSQVPCDKTALCGWCPFFLRGVETASASGCSGS